MFPSLVANIDLSNLSCDACEFGKHFRASFAPFNNKSSIPFTLIHTDVWGPSRTVSPKGHRWLVSFIDDFSHTSWLYMMKEKREVFSIFQNFHNMVHTQFGSVVKILKSDNKDDYIDSGLGAYSSFHRIIHQTFCTNTPQ